MTKNTMAASAEAMFMATKAIIEKYDLPKAEAYDLFATTFGAHMSKKSVEFKRNAPYYKTDHHHCWQQGKKPACGLTKHTQCCLCAEQRKP